MATTAPLCELGSNATIQLVGIWGIEPLSVQGRADA